MLNRRANLADKIRAKALAETEHAKKPAKKVEKVKKIISKIKRK